MEKKYVIREKNKGLYLCYSCKGNTFIDSLHKATLYALPEIQGEIEMSAKLLNAEIDSFEVFEVEPILRITGYSGTSSEKDNKHNLKKGDAILYSGLPGIIAANFGTLIAITLHGGIDHYTDNVLVGSEYVKLVSEAAIPFGSSV